MQDLRSIVQKYRQATRRLFLLDYDGVLAPIVSRPDSAEPSTTLKDLLTKLAANSNNTVVIVTGRSYGEIDSWLGSLPIDISAEHGSFSKISGDAWQSHISDASGWKSFLLPLLKSAASKLPGAFIEDKSTSLVFHYRNVDHLVAEEIIPGLKLRAQKLLRDFPVVVQDGKKVLDVHNSLVNKGTAINQWLSRIPAYDFVMIAGDDVTDEDMFKAAPMNAFTYHVGARKTAATYSVPDTSDFISVLSALSES